MPLAVFPFSLFFVALLLGLRHGIDWDHIAAITDITGSCDNNTQGFVFALLYILGHASIIVGLGILAVLFGIKLPSWIDRIMEPVVGITLILLGFFLLFSIAKHGKDFRLKSRWMVLLFLLTKFYNYIHKKIAHEHHLPHKHAGEPEALGKKTVFSIGMIHGIGAETPTQVLLFVTAAGIKGGTIGVFLLLTFVVGLIISNSFISFLSLFGYTTGHKFAKVYVTLGLLTGIFSLMVGIFFLSGHASTLPTIIGG